MRLRPARSVRLSGPRGEQRRRNACLPPIVVADRGGQRFEMLFPDQADGTAAEAAARHPRADDLAAGAVLPRNSTSRSSS